ncbi:MAG: hypothetical protein IT583_06200 [Verrucomicrobia bacterium]|nr:hypothetical protein [Verrucomicrobiota bacterium]
MKSKYSCRLGLVMAILATSGCANLNSSLSTEQRPSEISFDKYGFGKYLTEQERAEWQQMLIPEIKAACKPPYGTLSSATGWPTNRVRISAQSHFYLTEEERANVIGIVSFNSSYSNTTACTPANSSGDDFTQLVKLAYNAASYTPAKSEMTYVFLPGYMYACWYPGDPNENTVQPIPYSALLDSPVWLVSGKPNNDGDIFIDAFCLSAGAGRRLSKSLENIENIYAVNKKFIYARNAKVKEAANATEQTNKQDSERKLAELEKQATAILQKNQQANQKNISIKGIYIGMPIIEAETLLRYYLNTTNEDMEKNWLDRVLLEEKDGRLTSFETDRGIMMLLFRSFSITGEELSQQLADKYAIRLEVDAYGKSWQYRDTKKGIKIQIGGDGAVRMEQIIALIE